MKPYYKEDIAILEEEEEDISSNELRKLVIFDDDFNTFDHVIQTLIEICEHDQCQAEQCTLIIHCKGKCTVKTGTFEKLAPIRNAICKRSISAEVI